jgi:proteic killer suppression protein
MAKRGDGLQIEYKSRGLKKVCTNASEAEKKYGKKMAAKIHQRIDEITAADSVEQLIQYRVGGCHILKGDRKNQYAMDLIQPYRLVFETNGSAIQIVRVIEIINYH